MAFSNSFGTVVGRQGRGIATRGSRGAVRQIVAGMRRSSMPMDEWIIPVDIDETMDVQKKKPAA